MTVYLDKNMIDLSGRISSTYKLTGPASKLYMRVMASLALLSTLRKADATYELESPA